MDRLIYTAVSGMNASMTKQRMIANNMANAQTIGFREEIFQSTPSTLAGGTDEARSLAHGEVRGALMKEGAITQTGKPLDIALQGETMLAVQAMDGSEAYTRRGDLSISSTGMLENGDGLAVIGQNGPITVPLGSDITIAPDGRVMVSDPSTPDAPAEAVDRIKIASYTGTKIEKGLDGLFRAVPEGGVLPADENSEVMVGALEQSNVSPSEVLVQMVDAQRLFEIRSKLLSTAKDLDEGSARLMRIDG